MRIIIGTARNSRRFRCTTIAFLLAVVLIGVERSGIFCWQLWFSGQLGLAVAEPLLQLG